MELIKNNNGKFLSPKVGSIVNAYHPYYGKVEVKVVDKPTGNIIPVEFEGEEYSMRVGTTTLDGNKTIYHWTLESL